MTSFCCSYGTSTICGPFEISCFYLGEAKNHRYSYILVENCVFLSKLSYSLAVQQKKLTLDLKLQIFQLKNQYAQIWPCQSHQHPYKRDLNYPNLVIELSWDKNE